MSSKECVLSEFPNAYVKFEMGLFVIRVNQNGMGFYETLGKGITEDRDWDDAAEWLNLYF